MRLSPKKLLTSWAALNDDIGKLSLEQLEELLEIETTGAYRKSYVKRILKRVYSLKRKDAFKKYGVEEVS